MSRWERRSYFLFQHFHEKQTVSDISHNKRALVIFLAIPQSLEQGRSVKCDSRRSTIALFEWGTDYRPSRRTRAAMSRSSLFFQLSSASALFLSVSGFREPGNASRGSTGVLALNSPRLLPMLSHI